MRIDQVARLKDLAEKLADVFLFEAEPDNWPGDGKLPTELTQQERGDRFWSKRNAMGTGGVLNFALNVAKTIEVNGIELDDSPDLERQISEAEKRAEAAMNKVLAKVGR